MTKNRFAPAAGRALRLPVEMPGIVPADAARLLAVVLLAATATMRAAAANVDTGCPGDGTGSAVVGEYFFDEGSGTNAFNSGATGTAGDATLVNGAAFSTDVRPASA